MNTWVGLYDGSGHTPCGCALPAVLLAQSCLVSVLGDGVWAPALGWCSGGEHVTSLVLGCHSNALLKAFGLCRRHCLSDSWLLLQFCWQVVCGLGSVGQECQGSNPGRSITYAHHSAAALMQSDTHPLWPVGRVLPRYPSLALRQSKADSPSSQLRALGLGFGRGLMPSCAALLCAL